MNQTVSACLGLFHKKLEVDGPQFYLSSFTDMHYLQQAKRSLMDIAELLESRDGEFIASDQYNEFATEGEQ